jgi:hypothetical protein
MITETMDPMEGWWVFQQLLFNKELAAYSATQCSTHLMALKRDTKGQRRILRVVSFPYNPTGERAVRRTTPWFAVPILRSVCVRELDYIQVISMGTEEYDGVFSRNCIKMNQQEKGWKPGAERERNTRAGLGR